MAPYVLEHFLYIIKVINVLHTAFVAFRVVPEHVSPQLRPRDLREPAQRPVDEVGVGEKRQEMRLAQLVSGTYRTPEAVLHNTKLSARRDTSKWTMNRNL